jgi:hypothetical protein
MARVSLWLDDDVHQKYLVLLEELPRGSVSKIYSDAVKLAYENKEAVKAMLDVNVIKSLQKDTL